MISYILRLQFAICPRKYNEIIDVAITNPDKNDLKLDETILNFVFFML